MMRSSSGCAKQAFLDSDDLGAESIGTAWATEKLFQLINFRYNYRKPTVITTNTRLMSHMDERIRSRLERYWIGECSSY